MLGSYRLLHVAISIPSFPVRWPRPLHLSIATAPTSPGGPPPTDRNQREVETAKGHGAKLNVRGFAEAFGFEAKSAYPPAPLLGLLSARERSFSKYHLQIVQAFLALTDAASTINSEDHFSFMQCVPAWESVGLACQDHPSPASRVQVAEPHPHKLQLNLEDLARRFG